MEKKKIYLRERQNNSNVNDQPERNEDMWARSEYMDKNTIKPVPEVRLKSELQSRKPNQDKSYESHRVRYPQTS